MIRASGLFLHPTSLPSRFGIGDLGDSAYDWVDLLEQSKQSFWQVCPLGPTGYGDSPYQSFSSFAGNTLLISPLKLLEMELLTEEDIEEYPDDLPDWKVDYGRVINEKEKLYLKAYARFLDNKEFLSFCDEQRSWLEDYALFKVFKNEHGGVAWSDWEASAKLRFPSNLEETRGLQRKTIRYEKFLQFLFHKQWLEIREYANSKGIKIIGDIPYYTAYDSSDTWASPELFELDETGAPYRVAGVPPDYFSETGQLWGNPLYQWEQMRQDGYSWWMRRIRKALQWYDYIRLDHFRGFESYWAVPASSKTAVNGQWVRGPGRAFFDTIKRELGNVPIIAEDLGEITDGVEEMRRQVGIPGMKVLQFAFDGDHMNPYLPYNINSESIIYTGTHDNDTSLGWYTSLEPKLKTKVKKFLGCTDDTFLEKFIRTVLCATSRLSIIPFQDILGLGSSHRMNTPGKDSGNWQWRFTTELLNEEKIELLGELTSVYGRDNGAQFTF